MQSTEPSPRVPPPLPRRTTRSASPLPAPPPPVNVASVSLPSASVYTPTGKNATPPPLPARRRRPVSGGAPHPQPLLSASNSSSSLPHPRSSSHASHVSIVTPPWEKEFPHRAKTAVETKAILIPDGHASRTPEGHPSVQPLPLRGPDAKERHQDTKPGVHVDERATKPVSHSTTKPTQTLGLANLRWVEIIAVLLLFAQLLGFKKFAFIAALGLAHFFYVWVIPRPVDREPEPYPPPAAASENVTWINHTLRTLFPLISTDILAPFVDLLEDALMEQVPPIVTSVRVSSLSLGKEPLMLTSMRAISDDEWFSSLAEKKGHQHTRSGKSINDIVSTAASGSAAPSGKGLAHAGKHSRSVSNASSMKSVGAADAPGSPNPPVTAASVYAQNAVEKARRRKRDKLLGRIRSGRHRGQHKTDASTIAESMTWSSDSEGEIDEEGKEDDQFVNYEVSFAYRRTADMRSRGTGLHMLAHFGWGVRGVGGSEIPVYIDVVELRGTVRVRLLLSPSPPFAREASISFVRMPDFDISARPLRTHGLGSFNAMDIPLLKTYIQKSIAQVAAAFVSPKHYHMDVDRLLLGQDAALRTRAIGVLYIVIHGCSGLPRADTVGSCDPYVALSFQKFNKPLFSTRTIVDTQDPIFEEPAFILVDSEAIEVGEKLHLRVCDSDRFSADDALGVVELDLTSIVEKSTNSPTEGLFRRNDPLASDRPGMRAQGEMDWSVRFYPLWKMPDDELQKRVAALRDHRGEGRTVPPWWLEWLEKYMDKPEWEVERGERRKETLEYFTGERARDELEAEGKPPADMCSGVLQFHIHQCAELELDAVIGTYSGALLSRRKSAASGKPALNDVIDRAPSENPEPPSAYCEVHLNDKYVYRTRTKQVNPMPYFNAVSERFVRDWRLAKIVFVIKDERDMEHDPILGVVSLRLRDVLKDRSQFTRWFPLVGGLGWGKLRISLLFKPLDMRLPRGISTYEACTFDLISFGTVDLAPLLGGKHPGIIVETEQDRAVLHPPYTERTANESQELDADDDDTDSQQLVPHTLDTGHKALDWGLPKPVRLAVKHRHSCCVLFSIASRRRLKKSKVHALAILRLDDIADGEETHRVIPVFDTSSVKDVMKAASGFAENQVNPASPSAMPAGLRLVGFIRINFILHQGVSRAHKKLCKRDFKFRCVYDAWEATRLLDTNVIEQDSKAEDDESDSSSGSSSDDEAHAQASAAAAAMHDDDTKYMQDRYGAHSKALHKKNRGVFQLKIARTGKYVMDKLESKVISAAQGTRLENRPHGSDMQVEHEGQSRL